MKLNNLDNKDLIKRLQLESRRYIVKAIYNAQSSHIGSALSCIDLLIAQLLFINQSEKIDYIKAIERIVLSKGHGAAAIYGLLHCLNNETKYEEYYQNGSWYTGHISHEINHIPHSTGSLGHGLPVACGMAYANRDKLFSVILSDGELQEGSNWEALMVAPQLGIKNLIIAIDYNNQQSFGSVNETMDIEPIEDKLKSFGWNTYRGDGHDIANMISVYGKLLNLGKPFIFVADTQKGKGVSFMENKTKWHYSPPNKKEFEDALEEINENYK